ncbi:hypothetical protein HYV22_01715 [Candidatus Gottesmanbacteria bacterium]|nr:hypothetical protein [Candidatus Gottesmanbacteria bacterium]
MLSLLFLIFQMGFALFLFFLIIAFVNGAPYVPSTNPTAKVMIALARIKPGMTVYDLGSGDGRLLFLTSQKGANAIGLEINPFLVIWTWMKKIFSPYRSTITVRWQNFWKVNLADADIVFVYLLPWRMEKLAAKLKKELKPGSLVISNSFIFPKWKILRQDKLHHVYVFRL